MWPLVVIYIGKEREDVFRFCELSQVVHSRCLCPASCGDVVRNSLCITCYRLSLHDTYALCPVEIR